MDFKHTSYSIEKEFPKLVRDNIPALIEKRSGKPAQVRTCATDEEFTNFLLQKLVEEATEVKFSPEHGNLQEELADVLEIIDSILTLKGWTMKDVIEVQTEKKNKNGGFEKRILLLSL